MAQAEFESPIARVTGKLNKRQKDVYRKKYFRTPSGAVIAEGPQEVYHIANPRNYALSPVTPAEKAYQDLFAKACRMTKTELMPDAPNLKYWIERFEAQRKHPEVLDPNKPPKSYKSFRAFVRTALLFQLKHEQG